MLGLTATTIPSMWFYLGLSFEELAVMAEVERHDYEGNQNEMSDSIGYMLNLSEEYVDYLITCLYEKGFLELWEYKGVRRASINEDKIQSFFVSESDLEGEN